MSITKNENITSEGLANLLTRFKGQPNMEGFLSPFLDQIQELENVNYDLYLLRVLSNAEGAQLDGLGSIVGERRKGKDDTDYKAAIQGKIRINRMNSRIEEVILAMKLTHDAAYELRERGNAKFLMRLTDAWLSGTDPSLAVMDAALQHAKGGGVGALLQYSESDDDNTFAFAPRGHELVLPHINTNDNTLVSAYRMIDDNGIADLKGVNDAPATSGTVYNREGGPGSSIRVASAFYEVGSGFDSMDGATVACWIKPYNVLPYASRYPFTKGVSSLSRWAIRTDFGAISLYDDIDNAGADLYRTIVTPAQWHHVVAVLTPVTHENKLYIDGALVGSGTYATNGWDATASGLRLAGYTTVQSLSGNLCDVQIFNAEKYAAWVLAEYTRGIASIAANENFYDYPVARADIDIDDPSLVAAYRMKPTNGVIGSNVPNLVDGADAAVNNGATFEYGEMGDSLLFDGAPNVVLDTGSPLLSTSDATQPYTFFCWMKSIDPSEGVLFQQWQAADTKRFSFYYSAAGSLTYQKAGATVSGGGADVRDGTWHHVGFVKQSDQSVLVYKDGVSVDLTPGDDLYAFGTDNTQVAGSIAEPEVHIVDPQIYDEAKNLAWVQAEYAKGVAALTENITYGRPEIDDSDTSLVSAYRMYPDENDQLPNVVVGADTADVVGATLTYTDYGEALDFDGDDDSVDCGDGFNTLTEVTASFWMNADDVTTITFPFNNWLNTSDAWGVYVLGGNLYIFDDIDNAQASLYGTSVSVDTWYHVVATMSPTTHENKLYINGVLVGSGTNSSDDWASFNGNVYFGSRNTAAEFFDGEITNVQIHDEEKDLAWVEAEYAKGLYAKYINDLNATLFPLLSPPYKNTGWSDITQTSGGAWSDVYVTGE